MIDLKRIFGLDYTYNIEPAFLVNPVSFQVFRWQRKLLLVVCYG